jgi:hypothetical protein
VSTFAVRTEYQRKRLISAIEARPVPFTGSIVKGVKRSLEQNRLQRMWLLEAQEQGDQTAEQYRGFCKLHFGVPILRAEHDEFREKYDRIIRPLDYEQKLELMMIPMDFPVTRLMDVDQKIRYLNQIYQHFIGLGMLMTEPLDSGL